MSEYCKESDCISASVCRSSAYQDRIAEIEAENERLRANVHLAFYEGFERRNSICPDVCWDMSEAKKSLQESSVLETGDE